MKFYYLMLIFFIISTTAQSVSSVNCTGACAIYAVPNYSVNITSSDNIDCSISSYDPLFSNTTSCFFPIKNYEYTILITKFNNQNCINIYDNFTIKIEYRYVDSYESTTIATGGKIILLISVSTFTIIFIVACLVRINVCVKNIRKKSTNSKSDNDMVNVIQKV